MLPNEIKPFADANRQELEKIRLLLIKIRSSDGSDDTFTDVAELDEAVNMIQTISRSFDRFEACLRDEQATKNRYEKQHYETRLQKMREERK